MGRARVLHEVLVMRFEEIYGRFSAGRLNCEEASDLLGLSVSSFRRRRRRFEEAGLEGLVDARLGKASARRVPVDEVARMLALFCVSRRLRTWPFRPMRFGSQSILH